MRWTIIGAQGMLGKDMAATARAYGDVDMLDRDEIDITCWDEVARLDLGDVIVNCAAYTAVDQAESAEAAAFAVNALGAAHLARAARARGARLVQISTDYVFAGDATTAYAEDAPTGPRSAYGRTKLAGEWAVAALTDDYLIVRTAWLYGAGGNCFPKTMARLAKERDTLAVVTDQVGQPTWSRDVGELTVNLVLKGAPSGIYHATASGSTSWYGFTREIVAAMGKDPDLVKQTDSASFVRPAPRPAYSVLGHERLTSLGIAPIADWRERWALAAAEVLA